MNENWQIALFGLVLTGLGTAIVGSLWAFFYLLGKLSHLDKRLTRMETKFEVWLDNAGVLAAKSLHSENDHLDIDGYLDYYIEHHHEMSLEHWMNFYAACKLVTEKENASKLEKGQAMFLMELCKHKVQVAGMTMESLTKPYKT